MVIVNPRDTPRQNRPPNQSLKPWARVELWNGQKVTGTVMDEHPDGSVTVHWASNNWRGRPIWRRLGPPTDDDQGVTYAK